MRDPFSLLLSRLLKGCLLGSTSLQSRPSHRPILELSGDDDVRSLLLFFLLLAALLWELQHPLPWRLQYDSLQRGQVPVIALSGLTW